MSSTEAAVPEATPAVVLQVVPRLLPGGLDRDAVDIAGAVAAAGAGALLVTAGGPLVAEVYRLGIKPVFLPLEGRGPLALSQKTVQLTRLMRRHRVDIVHVHTPVAAWSAMLAARRAGCWLVTTCRGDYPGDGPAMRRYNDVMLKGDRIVAVSDFIAGYLRMQQPGIGDRLRLVERGVDLQRFDPQRVTAERVVRLAQHWRLPDGVPVVMLPGRFAPEKGQEVLIDAIARLGGRELICLLVGYEAGHPGYRAALEQRIGQLRLAVRVHIADDCMDLPAAYMLADVVVSAATSPGASRRTILEAQAMGRPIVAIDHGNARRHSEGAHMTWLAWPGDPGSLAAAIAEALELPPATRSTLSSLTAGNVAHLLSKDAMLDATLAIYSELLGAYGASPAAADDAALTPV